MSRFTSLRGEQPLKDSCCLLSVKSVSTICEASSITEPRFLQMDVSCFPCVVMETDVSWKRPVLMLSGKLVKEVSGLVVNGALVFPVVMETGNAVVYFWRNAVWVNRWFLAALICLQRSWFSSMFVSMQCICGFSYRLPKIYIIKKRKQCLEYLKTDRNSEC